MNSPRKPATPPRDEFMPDADIDEAIREIVRLSKSPKYRRLFEGETLPEDWLRR